MLLFLKGKMYVPISNKQCFTIMHDGMMAVTVLVLFTSVFCILFAYTVNCCEYDDEEEKRAH